MHLGSWKAELMNYEASGTRDVALAMDVVNGKIVETARAATTEGGGGGGGGGVMAEHHNQMRSPGVKPSVRGFDAGSSRRQQPEFFGSNVQQQVAVGNFASSQWAGAPTSYVSSDDTTTTTTTSPLHTWDGAAPTLGTRWSNNGRDFSTGMLQQAPQLVDHRQGWKRSSGGASGQWAMDVVNGKIVESARKMECRAGDHGVALGLKPSRARVAVDNGGGRRAECIHGRSDGQLPGSFAREWAPSWAASCFSDEPMASMHSWGHGAPSAVAPAPAGWSTRLVVEKAARAGAPGHGFAGLPQPETSDHRQGWKRSPKRSSEGSPQPSPKRSNVGTPWLPMSMSSQRWGSDQCHYRFDSSPCSEGKLDEEMTMFESQMTHTVSGHFSKLSSVASTLSQEISSLAKETAAPAVADASSAAEKKTAEFVDTSSILKRERSGLPDGDAVQGECGWIQPLKLLVRKGLTVSDVGELGRIIVPKKDAESQSFPQIDTKEGTVLEMEDYTASKRWYFRFKYWINNKSRMYVLVNTGDFIKFHSLKEHDIFVVYEDGCKKLVVCGQKKSSDSLDPVLELSKGSIVESSASETPPPTTTTEDESSGKEHHPHHPHL